MIKNAYDAEPSAASLVEQAPDGLFLADVQGRLVHVNAAGCRMLGYARDELLGKTITDLIAPEHEERLKQAREALLAGTLPIADWTVLTNHGAYLPVEVNAAILSDGRCLVVARDVSVRKRSELQLAEASASGILAISADALLSIDEDQRITMFNEGAEGIFGYARAEVIGAPVDILIPERFRAVHRQHVERFAAGQEVARKMDERTTAIFGRRKNGQEFPADAAISKLDVGGRRILSVALRDITEQKRVEAALRLAEAKASGIVSISADAIISIDADQRITTFNDGAEKIFGYSKVEAIGAPLDMLIPERFRAAHRTHLERFAGGREIARKMGERGAAIFGLRKDGEEFPADAAISKLEIDGMRILTVALRDITEHKRIEREQRFLAEAGAALASSLDCEETLRVVAQLAVRDLADFCIVDIVEEAGVVRRLKVAGKDPNQAWISDALQDMLLERSRPHLARSALETRRTALVQVVTPETIEALAQSVEHRRLLEAAAPRSIITVPLVVHEVLVGAIVLLSSRSSYGPADVRLAEDLAHRAALAIENARLYRAAQRATQSRDDVLGIVAHDLRSPLNSIGLQAELLGRHADEPVQRAAERIARGAARMNRLIQDLLDVARMEAGELSVEPVPVPPQQIASEVLNAERDLAASAKLELRLDLAPDLPEIWADRDRLLQIFENLIGNAVKFTPPGGRITIGASTRDRAVVFWVTDTGEGIAPEDQPHLFERFWQARKAMRRGAGLGLPIVKGLVEAHGGLIWVESAPGRGSTFYFTIPTAAIRERDVDAHAPAR